MFCFCRKIYHDHVIHFRLVVRIRCDAENAQCPLGMKFGVSVLEATQLLNVAKALDLDVVGVSFHVGSGCRDPPVFLRAIASARVLFDYAADKLGYDFNLLDIGGGFPGNTGTSIAEVNGRPIINNKYLIQKKRSCFDKSVYNHLM